MLGGNKAWIWCVVLLIVGVIIGILIGKYGFPSSDNKEEPIPGKNVREDITDTFLQKVNETAIAAYLRNLTWLPHLAGTPEDLRTAQQIQQHFLDNGFDTAKIYSYYVLLSYPDDENPNKVTVFDEAGVVVSESNGTQPPLYAPEEASPTVSPTFNAYSGTGIVEGEPLYVNYGTEEDFKYLEDRGISCNGTIVLARYGKIYRGNIVEFAEKCGATGVILFSDPGDFAPNGQNSVYPDTVYLPNRGVQSGTLLMFNGDPLTPHYPAVDTAYRQPENESYLPKIPCQPIGYADVENILRYISTDNESPDNWKGGLNVSYAIGPGFSNRKWTLKLEVRTANKMAVVNNAIAIMKGEEEPDRYVLLGNHRDAWILGAIDPTSGTALLMEIARVLGEIKASTGWRPRRSLVLCSWGAEEYSLIGSVEWAEEMKKVLEARAVAYLNIDLVMDGNYTLGPASNPLMYQLLYDSAKRVPNPNPDEVAEGRATVFDTWLHTSPSNYNSSKPKCVERTVFGADTEEKPFIQCTYLSHPNISKVQARRRMKFVKIENLGSGSDYTAFQQNLGIPSLDLIYNSKETPELTVEAREIPVLTPEAPNVTTHGVSGMGMTYRKITEDEMPGTYPLYHTLYETYHLVSDLLDRGFFFHKSLAQLWGLLALKLSDEAIIPFQPRDYAGFLNRSVASMNSTIGSKLGEKNITLDGFAAAVEVFQKATDEFYAVIANIDKSDAMALRRVNDQLLTLDRAFIIPWGLPQREFYNHIIFAPSASNVYAGTAFPGLGDLLAGIDSLPEPDQSNRWEMVRSHLAEIIFYTRSAAAILSDDVL